MSVDSDGVIKDVCKSAGPGRAWIHCMDETETDDR